MTTTCWACIVGLYEECWNPTPGSRPGWIIPCGALAEGSKEEVKKGPSHRFLDPDELSNDTSAGRKRAAAMNPILAGMTCEWAGLKFAGGGALPILGCRGNTIAQVKSTEDAKAAGADEVGHLHHGPDKAVLNNSPGVNLHRVCSRCHNRWHAINDPLYPEQRPDVNRTFLPRVPFYDHDPMSAYTDDEFEASEAWWRLAKAKRPEYPFTPQGVRVRLPMSEPGATVTTANPFEENGDLS